MDWSACTPSHKALCLLEELAESEGPFLVGQSPMIVDCVLMASTQIAASMHGVDLVEEHVRLKGVFEAFKASDTAVLPGNVMSVQ